MQKILSGQMFTRVAAVLYFRLFSGLGLVFSEAEFCLTQSFGKAVIPVGFFPNEMLC